MGVDRTVQQKLLRILSGGVAATREETWARIEEGIGQFEVDADARAALEKWIVVEAKSWIEQNVPALSAMLECIGVNRIAGAFPLFASVLEGHGTDLSALCVVAHRLRLVADQGSSDERRRVSMLLRPLIEEWERNPETIEDVMRSLPSLVALGSDLAAEFLEARLTHSDRTVCFGAAHALQDWVTGLYPEPVPEAWRPRYWAIVKREWLARTSLPDVRPSEYGGQDSADAHAALLATLATPELVEETASLLATEFVGRYRAEAFWAARWLVRRYPEVGLAALQKALNNPIAFAQLTSLLEQTKNAAWI